MNPKSTAPSIGPIVLKSPGRSTLKCSSLHHKSHMGYPGFEPGARSRQLTAWTRDRPEDNLTGSHIRPVVPPTFPAIFASN
jgi:hypothetical protein